MSIDHEMLNLLAPLFVHVENHHHGSSPGASGGRDEFQVIVEGEVTGGRDLRSRGRCWRESQRAAASRSR
jgi:hypothetical protein